MQNNRPRCERCQNLSYFNTTLPVNVWFCIACKDKGEILFEGVLLKVGTSEEIKPGDIYLAKRNTGWKLLTCKSIVKDSYIIPVENEYPFNINECYKVIGGL